MPTLIQNNFSSFSIVTATALGAMLFITSCGDNKNSDKPTNEVVDTYNTGEIKVAVDDAFQPLLATGAEVFHGVYPKANITNVVKSELEGIKLLLQDSVQLAIAHRPFTAEEKEVLKKQNFSAQEIKVAIDGLTVVVNKQNPDSMLTTVQLSKILKGEISRWEQIAERKYPNRVEDIRVVVDNANGANYNYLMNRLQIAEGAQSKSIFSAGSNQAVIDYVAENPNAIGFIGLNWIADVDDPSSVGFLKKVQVALIGDTTSTPVDYYQPYQGFLAKKQYPFRRDIYFLYRGGRMSLARGFTSFMATDAGQKMVLKAGLLPVNAVIRLVQVDTTGRRLNK